MPVKQLARQLGGDRAGLEDFSLAAKSGLEVPQSPPSKQNPKLPWDAAVAGLMADAEGNEQ
jgi:hypothetical protein